jgi:hypothetical protein
VFSPFPLSDEHDVLYVRFSCQVKLIGGEKREKNTFYYVSIPVYLNRCMPTRKTSGDCEGLNSKAIK